MPLVLLWGRELHRFVSLETCLKAIRRKIQNFTKLNVVVFTLKQGFSTLFIRLVLNGTLHETHLGCFACR